MKNNLLLIFILQLNFSLGQEKFKISSIHKFHKEINGEYTAAKTGPLTKADVATFKTLDFYPSSAKYFVTSHFTRTEKEQPFEMEASTDRKPLYVRYGEVTFAIDPQVLKLNGCKRMELSKQKKYKVYSFLPFSDRTSGHENCLGGRYVDLKMPKGNTGAIDFNTSYNLYCAYNYKYSCPKVPLENDLNIAVNAGVKISQD
jgi:hypothetical protein